MQIITFKTTLIIAAASLGLSSLACADQIPLQNDLPDDISFVQADGDQNGVLTRAEFEIFVALKASQNIDNYQSIQAKGLEHAAFSAKDLNSDGLLTPTELAHAATLTESEADPEPEIVPADEIPAQSEETVQDDIDSKSHGS